MDLLAARLQMAISLGFHIIFASIGIAMPFFMALSHWRYLKTKDPLYLSLTKAWSKGVALFFAVGAVSGTALSFELGLLWPEFMKHAGPIIGMPFSWEGAAFFIEAIALGLFLYGWEKLPPLLHWFTGLVVGISGVLSAFFVICANGWMNSPQGFDWVEGMAANIRPYEAMFNRAALGQGVHMVIAAFVATGFAVAGLHALLYLQGHHRRFHLEALKIALLFGSVAALIQPISGDLLAKEVAVRQPEKLAAMESLFVTQRRAPLVIGGVPNVEERTVDYGIQIPALLSFLAHADLNAEVKGLDAFPREEWPPVLIVHIAFQIMVGLGSLLALIATLSLLGFWRWKKILEHPLFLKALVVAMPLGFIAIEAGWTVTEVGRQPWIIYKVMKTADAVSPMPGLVYTLILYVGLYLFLALLLVWLMKRQVTSLHQSLSKEG